MRYTIYDYVSASGDNEFEAWWRGLEKPQRAKLRSRIDMLKLHGDGLLPEILTGTPVAGILKLRCRGNVQLRPLLCRGPQRPADEYTMLNGATERDSVFAPADAVETADARRAVVAQNEVRRTLHVEVSK